MAIQLSQRDLKRAASKFESLKGRINSIKKRAEKTTEKVIRTGETSAAAFSMGMIQGLTGKGIEVLGVPLELGLWVGLYVLGYFGGAGKHSDHLNNFGDGCLAAYATTLGRGVGVSWREKALGAGSQGALSARPAGVALTPAEVETATRMAAAVK